MIHCPAGFAAGKKGKGVVGDRDADEVVWGETACTAPGYAQRYLLHCP